MKDKLLRSKIKTANEKARLIEMTDLKNLKNVMNNTRTTMMNKCPKFAICYENDDPIC